MNQNETLKRVARQFIPNVGTIIVVVALLWAQQVGALGFLSAPNAASTTTISYQGRLADSNGTPVNDTLGMTFRIYNAASGGSPLWTETYPGIQVSDGLFHVLLGSTVPLPESLFNDNDTLYLGITVGADDEMSPREQLASAPWAMSVPNGSITTEKISDKAITDAKLARDYEMGKVSTDETWKSVTFSEPFDSVPLVLGTIVTMNGSDQAILNVRSVTKTGFEVRVEETYGDDGDHTTETIAWIALEP